MSATCKAKVNIGIGVVSPCPFTPMSDGLCTTHSKESAFEARIRTLETRHAALREVALEAAECIQVWLNADECDCEGSYVCGRPRVKRALANLRKALDEKQ